MRNFFQHHFNELHLYCRFKEIGFTHKQSQYIASFFGSIITIFLYKTI